MIRSQVVSLSAGPVQMAAVDFDAARQGERHRHWANGKDGEYEFTTDDALLPLNAGDPLLQNELRRPLKTREEEFRELMDGVARDRGDVPKFVRFPMPRLGPAHTDLQEQLAAKLEKLTADFGGHAEIKKLRLLIHVRAGRHGGNAPRHTFAMASVKHGFGDGLLPSEQWLVMRACDGDVRFLLGSGLRGLRLVFDRFVHIKVEEPELLKPDGENFEQHVAFSWLYALNSTTIVVTMVAMATMTLVTMVGMATTLATVMAR